MILEFKSNSVHQTLSMGRMLGALLSTGDVVCLNGELGTGKTVMIRGIANGLGHGGTVSSPTFTIIHCYPAIRLCHADAFRLSDPFELLDAGMEEYLDGDWICAVEWADRVRGALPAEALTVDLAFGEGSNERLIKFKESENWTERLAQLREEYSRYAGFAG